MAVAVHHVHAGTSVEPPHPPGRIPHALQRYLPALTDALGSTGMPTVTRIGAMSSYHLGWTAADGRPRGGGGGKSRRGCLPLGAGARGGAPPPAGAPAAAAV